MTTFASLEISYLVPGACWYPRYELLVYGKNEQTELVLKALNVIWTV